MNKCLKKDGGRGKKTNYRPNEAIFLISLVYLSQQFKIFKTMPRGIEVKEPGLLNRFRFCVEQNLKMSLSINKNYPLISEIILEKTGLQISTSTLKRTFDEKNTTKPSKYTLNAIAMAAGLISWDEFIRMEKKQMYFKLQGYILTLKYFGYRDWNDFRTIVSEFTEPDQRYAVMEQLVECAVKQGDIESLINMLDLPDIWLNIKDNYHGYFFFLSVGMSLRNTKIMDRLIPVYARHPSSQSCYVESFVDEEYLNGYYGDLMKEYIKHKKGQEAHLFYQCLMCQRDIENGIMNSEHYHYLITFRKTEAVHCYPLIRRLALLTIKYIDDKELVDQLLEEVLFELTNQTKHIFFEGILIYCYLVFTIRADYPIRRIFQLSCIETSFEFNNHVRTNYLNSLRIYEAFYLAAMGRKAEAQSILEGYNPFCNYYNFVKKFDNHKRYVERMLDMPIFSRTGLSE